MPGLEDYFNKLYADRKLAEEAASEIKRINILGESGIPGKPIQSAMMKSLMNYIDENAYRIASQRSAGGRGESDILAPGGEYSGAFAYTDDPGKELKSELEYSVAGKHFTSMGKDIAMPKDDPPDILKIFLGPNMEENTLPYSEDKPTSWSKDSPEQGWRSIKDHSVIDIKSSDELDTRYPGGDKDHAKESYFKSLTLRNNDKDVPEEINKMRKAVASGEYTPDMAVKGMGDSRDSFPGIVYRTQVDLGHYTESIGYDTEKEQYYFSVSDVWDFDPEMYSEIWSAEYDDPVKKEEAKKVSYTQALLMQSTGKSIGLYDRYYLPEDYMKDWFGELETEDIIIGDMKKMEQGVIKE